MGQNGLAESERNENDDEESGGGKT